MPPLVYLFAGLVVLVVLAIGVIAYLFHSTDPELGAAPDVDEPAPAVRSTARAIGALHVELPGPRRRDLAPAMATASWPPNAGPSRASASGRHRPAVRTAPRRDPVHERPGRHACDSATSAMPQYRPRDGVRVAPYTTR